MRRLAFVLVAAVGAALVVRAAAAPVPGAVPVLVELFTSEGCSSCPPADVLLQTLTNNQPVAGAEVVALGLHVDYWDHQGWKDRFASPTMTSRQQRYSESFRLDSIYTPQMIVDGRAELVGSDAGGARRAIEKASRQPHGRIWIGLEPFAGNVLRATFAVRDLPPRRRGEHADILAAITEDGLQSDVKRGENTGRKLAHAAVVRQLIIGGEAAPSGESSVHLQIALAPDWQHEHLKLIAFVQERESHHVLASAAVPLQSAVR